MARLHDMQIVLLPDYCLACEGSTFQLPTHCSPMNIPPAKLRRQPNAASPAAVLPHELIAEILSFLSVKPLMRLKCVSKSWNALISDPTFVKLHLHRSARNAHLTLMCWHHVINCTVVSFPVRRLLENHWATVPDDPCYRLNDMDCRWVVGSCNGLLCLYGFSLTIEYREHWLCFWNPATRIRSEKLGVFRVLNNPSFGDFKFAFGYDNSTDTYKVVALRFQGEKEDETLWRSEVRVFNLSDKFWRNIQSFPVVPLQCTHQLLNNGVNLDGTLNWLALRNKFSSAYDWADITVEQFVIVSLDLRTETYRQLLLPRGFDEVPHIGPTVGVLIDCLCFSHDFKGTDFVIWQMKEFGVEESWTPFLKISYHHLPIDKDIDGLEFDFRLLPLCLSENGDTLILATEAEDKAILYNWRDNRGERTRITNDIWWFCAKDYVESLVSSY